MIFFPALEEDGDSNHQIIVTVITPVVTTFGGDDVISGDNAADAQAKGEFSWSWF